MKTAVVIVHGVGDPLPGDALTKLTQGLSVHWVPVRPQWVEYRHEAGHSGDGDRDVPTFPVTKATLRSADNQTIHLREVYWGDLSRVKSSLLSLVSALFDFIFGLRYIIKAATGEFHGFDKAGGLLAIAALYMARGPMFALNILLAAVCCVYAFFISAQWPFEGTPWIAAPLGAVLTASVLISVAGAAVARSTKKVQWSPDTGIWMLVLSVLSLAGGVWFSGRLDQRLDIYTAVVTNLMTAGAILMVALGIASLAFVTGTRLASGSKRETAGPVSVIVFCTSLSLGLFTFAVIGAWTIISKALSEDPADRIKRCLLDKAKNFEACFHDKEALPPAAQIAARIEDGVHLLPLIVFAFAVLALLFFCVMFANWCLSRIDPEGQRKRFRYIVNPVVVVGYVGATVACGAAFIGLGWHLLDDTVPWAALAQELHKKDAQLKAAAIALTTVIVTVILSTRSHLLAALDLVLDVIAHFRTAPGGRFILWKRIVDRFRVVVEDTLRETGADRLIILSHSQGTTVAAHGLGVLTIDDCSIEPLALAKDKVILVTMGSPIHHLYCHYIPSRYRLAKADSVKQWLNISRKDDFIGTDISDPAVEGQQYPENENIGLGGHSDYWLDCRVVSRLVALL